MIIPQAIGPINPDTGDVLCHVTTFPSGDHVALEFVGCGVVLSDNCPSWLLGGTVAPKASTPPVQNEGDKAPVVQEVGMERD
jgi:hypothetical protein